jgi:hypothetical protein
MLCRMGWANGPGVTARRNNSHGYGVSTYGILQYQARCLKVAMAKQVRFVVGRSGKRENTQNKEEEGEYRPQLPVVDGPGAVVFLYGNSR